MKTPTNFLKITPYILVLAILALVALVLFVPHKKNTAQDTPSPSDTSSASATAAVTQSPETTSNCSGPEEVDRNNVEEVMQEFLKTAYCWDSVKDPNTTVAVLRAKPLLTDQYADSLNPDIRNSMNAEFSEAFKDKAFTVPDITFPPTDADHDASTDEIMTREAIVEYVWMSPSGHSKPGGRALVTVGAEKSSNGQWAINNLQINSME